MLVIVNARHPIRCDQREQWFPLYRLLLGNPRVAVLDQMPKRLIADFAMIEMQKERRCCAFVRCAGAATVTYDDVVDRLGMGREIVPHVQGTEHPARGKGDGRYTPVKARVRDSGGVEHVHHDRLDAPAREGQAQRKTCQPPADDQGFGFDGCRCLAHGGNFGPRAGKVQRANCLTEPERPEKT